MKREGNLVFFIKTIGAKHWSKFNSSKTTHVMCKTKQSDSFKMAVDARIPVITFEWAHAMCNE